MFIYSWVNMQLVVLDKLHILGKRIDKVNTEWSAGKRLKKVNSFLRIYYKIKEELDAISLDISYREALKTLVKDAINSVYEYKDHAQDLTMDDIQIGDFVMLKQEVYDIINISGDYTSNVFRVNKKIDEDKILLSGLIMEIPISSLKAIPIDGISDAEIYYDPVVMASFVQPGQPLPVRYSDYSYYIQQFNKSYYDDKTYNELLAAIKPQFVHEVQHWLREKFYSDDLKINPKTKFTK